METSPSSAIECRERARRCFELAIAEENVTVREAHLRQGEAWMLRWKHWPPDPKPSITIDEAVDASSAR